jgi:hypothetical protein
VPHALALRSNAYVRPSIPTERRDGAIGDGQPETPGLTTARGTDSHIRPLRISITLLPGCSDTWTVHPF